MIKTGVQKEVKAAIQPIEERLELQEKVNKDLHNKLSSLVREMDILKETSCSKQQAVPVVAAPQVEQHHQLHQEVFNQKWQLREEEEKVKSIISLSED